MAARGAVRAAARRRVAALALIPGMLAAGPVSAAELVLFETAGCPWCIKWHREIAPIYGATEEGRRLPLRRVDLDRPRPPDLTGVVNIRYTPTFVVMACGGERGRIVGYDGDEAFWGELMGIATALPATADC